MPASSDDHRSLHASDRYELERIKRRQREKMRAPDGKIIDRNAPWPPTDPNARESSAR